MRCEGKLGLSELADQAEKGALQEAEESVKVIGVRSLVILRA